MCDATSFICDVTPGLFFCLLTATDGLYTYRGTDEPEQTHDGRSGENQFRDNKILNTGYGAKIKEADNTVITGEMTPENIATFHTSYRLRSRSSTGRY